MKAIKVEPRNICVLKVTALRTLFYTEGDLYENFIEKRRITA